MQNHMTSMNEPTDIFKRCSCLSNSGRKTVVGISGEEQEELGLWGGFTFLFFFLGCFKCFPVIKKF